MPDPSISDDDVLRVTQVALERIAGQPPPRDIEGEVMRLILAPPPTRRIPAGRLLVSGLAVAAIVAAGCVALVLHVDRPSSPGPSTGSAPGGWRTVSGPSFRGGDLDELQGVACVSVSACWAVGSFDRGTQTLIEQYTAGKWSTVSSPAPPPGNDEQPVSLNSVTCFTASDCWAVGAGPQGTLIEQDTGSGWRVVSSATSFGGGELSSVTCVSVTDCWAVGQGPASSGTGNDEALIEQDTGSGWSVVPSPYLFGNPPSELQGVACVSASDCWAVGWYLDGLGGQHTLIEQYTGSGWDVPDPFDSKTGGQLLGVTCTRAGDCWAVGWYLDGTPGGNPLIERGTGSDWRIVTSPQHGGPLYGVTCVSASDCWAVGAAFVGTTGQMLIEQDTGSGWSMVSRPTPSGSAGKPQGGGLAAVACVSVSDCWAVGSSSYAGGNILPTVIAHTEEPPG
jgi:hypothetical protein